MAALADLIEEQVIRRQWNRKFLDDNARACRGLTVREEDVPQIKEVVVTKEVEKDNTSTEKIAVTSPPPQPQINAEKSPLEKWGPIVLAAALGAGAGAVPWAMSGGGNDSEDKPVAENVDIDSSGDINITGDPNKKSIFQVIQDEMKHVEDE